MSDIKITEDRIDYLINSGIKEVRTVFDKCTVVSFKTIDGFVLVESSACIDPENYDVTVGEEICMEAIRNKLWELEGYRLQYESCIPIHSCNDCNIAKTKIDCLTPEECYTCLTDSSNLTGTPSNWRPKTQKTE